jgi:2',3'-cyclic-nucleotide 2'-phosphodiesterase (5'-nucleotidase family)
MVEKNGVQIGIIGAIGNCYSSISGEQTGGFYFKTGSDLTNLVKAEADRLRSQGADFIVYSIHDDHGEYDYSLSNGYVVLVFEGHTHQDYVTKDSKGVYHLQGGGDNDGISQAEVKINFVTGSYVVSKAEFISTATYKNLADDPIVNTLMEKYADQISQASKVLWYNEKYREGDEILQKCADLYYQAGMERWGDKYEIALGGGFMSVRSPYNLPTGTITYGDLQNILPFDNQLVLCSISGYYLKKNFFETTNSRYYIYYGDYGANLKENIDNNATYYLVTDTYSSTYGPNHLTEIARYDAGVYARDLLAKYIEAGGYGSAPATIKYTDYFTIYAKGDALADNGTTAEVYYVKGKIIDINNTTYGNFTIQDDNGNTLYVYGLSDKSGNRYDAMSNPPKVGDTVVLQAPIKKYVYNGNTTIELFKATLWSIE